LGHYWYKEKNKDLVRIAGGDPVGYYQVIAQEKVNEDEKVNRPVDKMVEDTLKFVPEIQKLFSASQ